MSDIFDEFDLGYSPTKPFRRTVWRRGANTGNRKTHCIAGHEFTEANTRWRRHKNGRTSQVCRTCKRLADRMGHGKQRS